ncbi:hypothetical protein CANCADRAFT_4221 [Tortispora caseinolytica NRRL Y-17796]|uniref:Sec20 C-terminal domain-containing protein n=1 Tax=Tortispora caseinolytica NRRL Y-17796 TaxID=767744 RepID=A0A1E4TD14_9ASCO|nr:hypothetical protein CANCADRAFT_4221 [Tortispora caseinolytica NRRL Y-17796]
MDIDGIVSQIYKAAESDQPNEQFELIKRDVYQLEYSIMDTDLHPDLASHRPVMLAALSTLRATRLQAHYDAYAHHQSQRRSRAMELKTAYMDQHTMTENSQIDTKARINLEHSAAGVLAQEATVSLKSALQMAQQELLVSQISLQSLAQSTEDLSRVTATHDHTSVLTASASNLISKLKVNALSDRQKVKLCLYWMTAVFLYIAWSRMKALAYTAAAGFVAIALFFKLRSYIYK